MSIIELLTSGIGGFGLGIVKNIFSKGIDTVKDVVIAKYNIKSEENTKAMELEAQKNIASSQNANLLIELEKEKIQLRIQEQNSKNEYLQLLQQNDTFYENTHNSKLINIANFFRGATRPLLTFIGFIIYLIIKICCVFAVVFGEQVNIEIINMVNTILHDFETIIFIMIGYWFAVKSEEAQNYSEIVQKKKT